MQRLCSGVTRAGERCKSFALADSTFCITHDPARVTDIAEYRKRGGAGRSHVNRARKSIGDLRNLAGLQATLLQAIEDVKTGALEPPMATAIATLARALVAVAGVNAMVSFEAQIAAMAAQIHELERRPA